MMSIMLQNKHNMAVESYLPVLPREAVLLFYLVSKLYEQTSSPLISSMMLSMWVR